MKKKPTPHPSSVRRFQEVTARFLQCRENQRRAADLMWAGMLVSGFSDDDLALLKDYLSPYDIALVARAARRGR